jgi:hypothetical protein
MRAMPAIVPIAHATAAAVIRDGLWSDPSGASDVQLLVVGHRVVAARGGVDQQPAESGIPITCERALFSFVGPIGAGGNRSTARAFHFDQDYQPWFSISGRVVSATRISGTLVKRAGGHGDYCAGTVKFTVQRVSG